jgi:ABC-type lipoprotein release transport system permease subunit
VALTYRQAQDVYMSNIVIQPGSDMSGKKEDFLKQTGAIKNKIYSIPGVIDCCSRYTINSIISYDPDKTGKNARSISWPVKSINPAEEINVINLHNHMIEGEFLSEFDRDKIIMGREISGGHGSVLEVQTLRGAAVGDEVTVRYQNGVSRKYTIKGIYATSFSFADMTVFITQKEMESILNMHDRASEILVKTSPEFSYDYYKQQLHIRGIDNEEIRPVQISSELFWPH